MPAIKETTTIFCTITSHPRLVNTLSESSGGILFIYHAGMLKLLLLDARVN
jgi:hypothetical protein